MEGELGKEKARLEQELDGTRKKAADAEAGRYTTVRGKEQAERDLEMERAETSSLRENLNELEKTRTELQEACVGGHVAEYRQGIFQMLDKIHVAGLPYQDFLPQKDVDLLAQAEASGEYVSKLSDPAPQPTDSMFVASPRNADDGGSGEVS